jgi:YidC/Oxa1 family membrane protein insertase
VGFLSDNFISDFFVTVLKWVHSFVFSYPVAIIVLTIAIRVLILPVDLRQKQSSRKMALVQPKVESLKKRYGNNPQLMQKKQQELFKKEGIRPLAGCLPMLITLPIFFAFFGAMRVLATEQQVSFILNAQNTSGITQYAETATELPGFLWVHNLWQPDSGLEPILPTAEKFTTQTIQQNLNNVSPQALHMMSQTGLIHYDYTQEIPKLLIGADTAGKMANYDGLTSFLLNRNGLSDFNNGWFILPLLAGATLFFQQKMTMGQNPQAAQQQGGKLMLWFFPIFSIYICATSNAAFAIYWLFANIYAVAQTYVLNLIYKKRDEKAKQGVIEEAT